MHFNISYLDCQHFALNFCTKILAVSLFIDTVVLFV